MEVNSNKILIPLAIILAGALIAGNFYYVNKSKTSKESLASSQETAQKALDYINENLLPEGLTSSLIDVVEESGLYKFRLKIGEKEYPSYVTKDGKILFLEEGIDLEKAVTVQPETQEEKTPTIGNFLVGKEEICKENEKPIIYFFGSQSCPHCKWEHPIVEKVAKSFEGYISFHNNMDANADTDIFGKYSTGGIPTLVFGCKYYRVGSGEGEGEELESKNLTAIICKLTGNQPSSICNLFQDLINQIP